jgi:hypothetical protein
MSAVTEPWVKINSTAERPELGENWHILLQDRKCVLLMDTPKYDNISHAEWEVNQHTHKSIEDPWSVHTHANTYTHTHANKHTHTHTHTHEFTFTTWYEASILITCTHVRRSAYWCTHDDTIKRSPLVRVLAQSFRSVCVYSHKTTDAGRHAQKATSYFWCDKVQTTWTPTVKLVAWASMAAKKSITTWSLFLNMFCVYCKFCGFCSFSPFSIWTSTFQRYRRQSPKFNNIHFYT